MTDAPRVAGSEVWLRDLLPLLAQYQIEASLFLPKRATLEPFAQTLAGSGVALHWYDHQDELPGLTKDFDLRVVQAWEPSSYARLLPKLMAPRLVVSHDQLDYHYAAPIRAAYREIFRVTKARLIQQADGVITVSGWATQFLTQTMRLPHVQGMTNGANIEKFRPANETERSELRDSLGFDRFTVLVPGRFTFEKNQMVAVLAARYAPELDFVFVGDMDSGLGAIAQRTQQLLRLGNVRFLGRRHDMPELYRAADVLLQPTLAENQSLVTLEAMSSGLPVVTTDIPAQAELVCDGIDGLCVGAQPHLVAAALRALAAHPAKARAMGASARQRVLQRHTTANSAAQLAALLQAAAARH